MLGSWMFIVLSPVGGVGETGRQRCAVRRRRADRPDQLREEAADWHESCPVPSPAWPGSGSKGSRGTTWRVSQLAW